MANSPIFSTLTTLISSKAIGVVSRHSTSHNMLWLVLCLEPCADRHDAKSFREVLFVNKRGLSIEADQAAGAQNSEQWSSDIQ